MYVRVALSATALAMSVSGPLAAATTAEAGVGSRVRIHDSSGNALPITGTLTAVSAERLELEPSYGDRLEVPRASVKLLEVSGGIRRRSSDGALMGAVVGVALALVAEKKAMRQCESSAYCLHDGVLVGLFTVPLATAVGLGIGSGLSAEVWNPSRLPAPVASHAPEPRAMGLRFALRF
jgi:hypothetical protein